MLLCSPSVFSKLTTISSVSAWQSKSFQVSDCFYFPLLSFPLLTHIFTELPQTQHNIPTKASPVISRAEGWLHLSRKLHSSYQNPIQCLPFLQSHSTADSCSARDLLECESLLERELPAKQLFTVPNRSSYSISAHMYYFAPAPLNLSTHFCNLSWTCWIVMMASSIHAAISSPRLLQKRVTQGRPLQSSTGYNFPYFYPAIKERSILHDLLLTNPCWLLPVSWASKQFVWYFFKSFPGFGKWSSLPLLFPRV